VPARIAQKARYTQICGGDVPQTAH